MGAAAGEHIRRTDGTCILGDLATEHEIGERRAARARRRGRLGWGRLGGRGLRWGGLGGRRLGRSGFRRLGGGGCLARPGLSASLQTTGNLRRARRCACLGDAFRRGPSRLLEQRSGEVDRAQAIDEAADRHRRVALIDAAIAVRVHHRPRIHGRDARTRCGLGGNRYELSRPIHGSPTAVASGDGGVGLDPGAVVADARLRRKARYTAAGEGDGLAADARIPEDGQGVAQFQRVGIANFDIGEFQPADGLAIQARGNAQHGQVLLRRLRHNLGDIAHGGGIIRTFGDGDGQEIRFWRWHAHRTGIGDMAIGEN